MFIFFSKKNRLFLLLKNLFKIQVEQNIIPRAIHRRLLEDRQGGKWCRCPQELQTCGLQNGHFKVHFSVDTYLTLTSSQPNPNFSSNIFLLIFNLFPGNIWIYLRRVGISPEAVPKLPKQHACMERPLRGKGQSWYEQPLRDEKAIPY